MKEQNPSEWSGWTCDDIIPNLCPLEVERGSLTVRGLRLVYWRYKKKSTTPFSSFESLPPLIVVHGGPAMGHNYTLPLKAIACAQQEHYDREIIFYDQVGCGESEIVQNIYKDAPWLYDIHYYADEELPRLLEHLNITEYHYLGSSWGTIVGQLFALNQPKGLRSMTLSGPVSDYKLYIDAQWDDGPVGTVGSVPPFIQSRMRALENQKAFQSPEYQAIDQTLTSFFTTRTFPLVDCLQQSVDIGSRSSDLYVGIQGPSEFTGGGVLADFNITGRLYEIQIPVLLTSGQYDTMRPRVVDAMEQSIPWVERHTFLYSGHCSMIDEPEAMNLVVSNFIARMERKTQPNKSIGNKHNIWSNVEITSSPSEPSLRSQVDYNLATTASTMSTIPMLISFLVGFLSCALLVKILEQKRNHRSVTYERL